MQTKPETAKRNHSFDIIRIIAIVAVVMIHTASPILENSSFGSFEFTFGNFFDSIARPAVPLFLMISGSLLLDENRKISFGKTFRSIRTLACILIFWSVFYAVVFKAIVPPLIGKAFDSEDFSNALFEGHYHLWYLFMLIGIYLITPLLKLFVRKENAKYVLYFLVLSFSLYLVPLFADTFLNPLLDENDIIQNYIEKFRFDYANEFLTYYLLGWYVTNVKIKKGHRITIYLLGIIGLAITFFCTQTLYTDSNEYNMYYSTAMLNVMFYALALFIFFYNSFSKKDFSARGKLITTLSQLTFGVYLIHPAVLFLMRSITENFKNTVGIFSFELLATLLISFLLSFIISKIPLLKKIIRG